MASELCMYVTIRIAVQPEDPSCMRYRRSDTRVAATTHREMNEGDHVCSGFDPR